MSPKSEHSVWGASSSDSDLQSLATRLRTTSSSAKFSQDGMFACTMPAVRGGVCGSAALHTLLDCFASVSSSEF